MMARPAVVGAVRRVAGGRHARAGGHSRGHGDAGRRSSSETDLAAIGVETLRTNRFDSQEAFLVRSRSMRSARKSFRSDW